MGEEKRGGSADASPALRAHKIGPGIAYANGREVKYCICEEEDGENAECPIHGQGTK
jgi:hypothetical protein